MIVADWSRQTVEHLVYLPNSNKLVQDTLPGSRASSLLFSAGRENTRSREYVREPL